MIIATYLIDPNLLKKMFDLYVNTYKMAKQEVWFTNSQSLLRYTHTYFLDKYNPTLGFIMFRKLKGYINKIGLIAHNGTKFAKTKLVELINMLAHQRGWIIETSGALSWILKKLHSPMITDTNKIRMLVCSKPNQDIYLNSAFDTKDKNQQFYVKTYRRNDGTIIEDSKTLFGTL
jgi:hypothetical protein